MNGPFPSLAELNAKGKRLLARTLTRLETEAGEIETAKFLDGLCGKEIAHVIGITGPPGVGKSSLTDVMIRSLREQGKSVAVLAIDPSSPVSSGALLGDRTRLQTDPDDEGLFVRSMAARDKLGGLSDHTVASLVVLRSLYDIVIVETVGIGQSEGDLKLAVDTVLLCVQPGSGDSLQFMKAGIMELPDVVAVTKADMGAIARRAASDVEGALSLSNTSNSDWKVQVCEVSSRTSDGIGDMIAVLKSHHDLLISSGALSSTRLRQQAAWVQDMIKSEFGNTGIEFFQQSWRKADPELSPFLTFSEFSVQIRQLVGLDNRTV